MTGQTQPAEHPSEIHSVDSGDPLSRALLTRAYYEIYMPSFPIVSERDSLQAWLDIMAEKDRLAILIAGHDLNDPPRATIKALAVAFYLPEGNTGQLSYNAINPRYHGQGLGKMLIRLRVEALEAMARAHGHDRINGIFLELNNPDKIAARDDSYDPARRLQMYKRWGARRIPIDYVQPAVEQGGPRCYDLLLLAWPVRGAYPEDEAVRDYLRALYRDRESGVEVPEEDPDFLGMINQLIKTKT